MLVIIIDLTEALRLDYLHRDALILKLQQGNFSGKYLNVINCMFHKSISRVKYNVKYNEYQVIFNASEQRKLGGKSQFLSTIILQQ